MNYSSQQLILNNLSSELVARADLPKLKTSVILGNKPFTVTSNIARDKYYACLHLVAQKHTLAMLVISTSPCPRRVV